MKLSKETILTLRSASKVFHIPYWMMVNVIYMEERKFWKTEKQTCDAIVENLAEGSIS